MTRKGRQGQACGTPCDKASGSGVPELVWGGQRASCCSYHYTYRSTHLQTTWTAGPCHPWSLPAPGPHWGTQLPTHALPACPSPGLPPHNPSNTLSKCRAAHQYLSHCTPPLPTRSAAGCWGVARESHFAATTFIPRREKGSSLAEASYTAECI